MIKIHLYADDTLIYSPRSSTNLDSYTCSETPTLTNILFQIHTSDKWGMMRGKRKKDSKYHILWSQ